MLKRETCQIKDTDGSKYDIHKGIMNCSTNVIIFKFHWSSCSKQYIENNIKDFHFDYNSMDDWKITLIDRADKNYPADTKTSQRRRKNVLVLVSKTS